MHRAFASYDLDGDGHVREYELAVAIQRDLGIQVSEGEATAMLDLYV